MGSSLDKDGKLYGALHDPSDRLITSAVMTCVMLLVATGLSFFLPTTMVLMVLFAPGVLTFAFGGALPRRHKMYNLTTNQRLAIERYDNADKETQKLFPKGWVETVRNASGEGWNSDQHQLAAAAEKITTAAQKRNQSMNLRDDKVEVALKVLEENTKTLELDAEARKPVDPLDEIDKLELPAPKRRKRLQDR